MARFNQSRKRTQRYVLRGIAKKLLVQEKMPFLDSKGQECFNIGGRHYVLPKTLK